MAPGRPRRLRRRRGKHLLFIQRKDHRTRNCPQKAVETLSNFHLVGDEIKQMYMVHYARTIKPCAIPANLITATCIHLFWTETFSAIARDLEIMKTRYLTGAEKDVHMEHVISVKNLQKLKGAEVPLELGTHRENMRMDIRRYNHRLATGHPHPFGKYYEEGDAVETDPSSDEDWNPTDPMDPQNRHVSGAELRRRRREMKERMEADLRMVKREILEGTTTMEQVEETEDAKFVECLKKLMEAGEDSEGVEDSDDDVDKNGNKPGTSRMGRGRAPVDLEFDEMAD